MNAANRMRYAAALDLNGITFHVPRVNQGQMVEIAYALDADSVIRRTTDHASRETIYEVAPRELLDESWYPGDSNPRIDARSWREAYAIG